VTPSEAFGSIVDVFGLAGSQSDQYSEWKITICGFIFEVMPSPTLYRIYSVMTLLEIPHVTVYRMIGVMSGIDAAGVMRA
jgi:hypothetical protein